MFVCADKKTTAMGYGSSFISIYNCKHNWLEYSCSAKGYHQWVTKQTLQQKASYVSLQRLYKVAEEIAEYNQFHHSTTCQGIWYCTSVYDKVIIYQDRGIKHQNVTFVSISKENPWLL